MPRVSTRRLTTLAGPFPILLAASLTCVVTGAGQSVPDGFAFVATDTVDAQRFLGAVETCSHETKAFADLMTQMPTWQPLRVHVAEREGSEFFGRPQDPHSDMPLLGVSLEDFARLPTSSDVRHWSVDSSWAVTRCEMLGHELAEAIHYRALWDAATEDSGPVDTRFARRIAPAHRWALEWEGRIAADERTRLDATGRPYGRIGFCTDPEQRLIRWVVGANTETFVFRDGIARRVEYTPGRNLCGAAYRRLDQPQRVVADTG